ncbi:prepilin peptidase [Bradyrhizobium sp. HKCCYLS1011]|uniref:prepilin peptidase n=1 Tax=Bradyrhizobium sp. HKCCYLS1011 TaxID=3420733 RepID=UPI003EC035BD
MLVLFCLLLLGCACLALAWIDFRAGIIPDAINLAIAVLGAARAAALGGWSGLAQAAAEGIVIGALIWLLRRLYFMLRGLQGLGLGDVKLLAASALWVGAEGIPTQLLVASVAALLAAAGLQLGGQAMTRQTALPFGPFLALGLLVTLALQQTDWLNGLY